MNASSRERALEIAERLRSVGPIEVNRFFSGAGLRKDGVQFAFVIGGTLYLKADEQSRPAFEASGAKPFSYSSRSQIVRVTSYWEAPDEVVDDLDALLLWVGQAQRAATAALKKRPRSPKKPRA
jgi:DNA transformation protein and related proteins